MLLDDEVAFRACSYWQTRVSTSGAFFHSGESKIAMSPAVEIRSPSARTAPSRLKWDCDRTAIHGDLRFPGMKNAPLVETRVCNTKQSRIATSSSSNIRPAENVWMSAVAQATLQTRPPIGELVARRIIEPRRAKAQQNPCPKIA